MNQNHLLPSVLFAAISLVALPTAAPAEQAGKVSNSNLNYKNSEAASPIILPNLNDTKPAVKKAPEKEPVAEEPSKPAKQKKEKQLNKPKNAEQSELKRIEYYLNSINTVVADFTQVAPDGSIASGKFYLQRPGKMRWQYEPPTPVLIIANNESLVYYDYELEQVTHLPVHSSLASILARKHIDLDDPDLVVEELVTSPGAARVKIHEKGNKEEGSMLLEMSDQPLRIRNIVVTDAQGQTTTISLNKARFGVPLRALVIRLEGPTQRSQVVVGEQVGRASHQQAKLRPM